MAAPPRMLRIDSPAIPTVLGRPGLEPSRLAGQEGLNQLFAYELLLKTPDDLHVEASGAADFDLDAFIGREISCQIDLEGGGVREINALIAEAQLWGQEGRLLQYKLTLRPWLHLATLRTDLRIFQNMTVVDLLDELLGQYVFPVDKRLVEHYPPRDYQTQFNESDHAFFERLCQEWGISYFFEHSQGKHRLVLVDHMGGYKPNPHTAYQAVEYHPPGWKTDAEHVHHFAPRHQLTSGRYATTDYDYTRPRADLAQQHRDPRPTGYANAEVYEWHAGTAGSHFAQPRAGARHADTPHTEGRQLSRLRMEALRTAGARAAGSANLRGMVPGCSFSLLNHPRAKANAEYLALETRLLVENAAAHSQPHSATADARQRWRVEVDFVAHPLTEPLRPAPTRPKPFSHGPQVARVVGPPGQNLWTDDFGRIKVQFPWDRKGPNDDRSSCWVRVCSPWAGNQLGGMHVPRIGQEVIVGFIGGDPDLPLCMGRVYNQDNLPPWTLPGQAALSGFRSRELAADGGGNSAAGRSNHLLLDDSAGRIQAQLKSDHHHSQLSLGHVTRVEDNAGRKDARGEGFELRTDGWGAVRTDKGLLISTDGRASAVGGLLSRDELVACLEKALVIARDLGKAAAACDAGPRDTGPQRVLNDAVEALGHGASNEAQAQGPAAGGQPVLALSGAAGIACTTPRNLTQYAGLNIDSVAAHDQQHYADRSIRHTAGQDIDQFARTGDIRVIASEGQLIQQAQHGSVELTGEKSVTVQSTEAGVTIKAKKSITLALDDGTYLRMSGGRVVWGMEGDFLVQTSNLRIGEPSTVDIDLPSFRRTDQAQQLKFHQAGDKTHILPDRAYKIFKAGGGQVTGETGSDAISKLDKDTPFDIS